MTSRLLFALPLAATLALGTAAAAQQPARAAAPTAADSLAPPPLPREFRAAWVATVANIDWPSRPGLSVWQQQEELLHILNVAASLRLNAIILQMRPAADALYPSRYEPWSYYLTGQMGRAPEPVYDPLAMAVAEAHKRGLELHVWFNPYRARQAGARGDISANHVSRADSGLVRRYGRSLWLDPGDPAVVRYSLRVVLDVVRRYDIDGVHIDDYFYPYKERDSVTNALLDFPDSVTYARYQRRGGTLGRDDWRRQNVDTFVRQMYAGVKAAKPWVKVGISPFGIWRPGNPEEVRGFDAYQELYADSKKWLQNGWVDYFTPQLYWPVAAPQQSYPSLLRWWAEQNTKGRHLWPGNYTSRVASGTGPQRWTPSELLEQVRRTRAQPGATGNVHFSMKALLQEREGLADSLRTAEYAQPAIVPASPWLGAARPPRPLASVRRDTVAGGLTLTLRPAAAPAKPVWLWAVQTRTDGVWSLAVLPGAQRTHTLVASDAAARPEVVVVKAIDRLGNESLPATVRPPRPR